MRRLLSLLALALVLLPGPVLAQDDDRSRIVRFLEEQLSDGARQVTIRGFRGALSSTAELDLLTIADAEGVWLTLEGAELTWSRAALLRGALQIDSLTAERLEILRAPVTEPAGLDLPPAEATPFALPELPVSIAVDRTAIARVSLGPTLLGQAVELSVEGSARLADGEGAADIELLRLDGPRGAFDLAAGYGNTTRVLDLSLLVEEEAGGLAATLLGLPGAPAIRLTAAGAGPIDGFEAQIALDSDGEPRLAGTVATRLALDTGVRSVDADIGGDITPLFLPDYRDFFGPDVGLVTRLRLMPDGAVELDTFSLRAAQLALAGQMSLAPGGQPRAFELTGRIAGPEGSGPVRLPVPDAVVTVGAVDLGVSYNAAAGDGYRAQALVQALDLGPAAVESLRLDAGGTIAETDAGLTVASPITLVLAGLTHADPALSQALGSAATLSADLSWQSGGPLGLANLVAEAGDLALRGDATLTTGGARLVLATALAAEAGDLARFAPLARQPLAGRLSAQLDAEAELLSGAFDVVLTGTGTDLRVAEGVPPALLAGDTTLTLSAVRDETGLILRELTLQGRELSLAGTGRVSSGGALVDVDARLANVGLFTDALSGPVTAALDATRGPSDAAPWRIVADLRSQAGISTTLRGDVQPADGTVDLTATGQLPLALANRALAPRSVFGTLGFDLAMRGAPGLDTLSGSFRTGGARVTLPTFGTALENVTASGTLSAGRVSFDAGGALGTGGSLSASGTVTVNAPSLPAQITVTGRDLRIVDPTLYEARIASADITVGGALAGTLQVGGTVVLGETELRVPETGLGGSAPIPPIAHLGETAAERRTRIAAGLGPVTSGGGGSQRVGLDLTIRAPGRVFIRGRGLDAELGGQLRIFGTTANVIPEGRFDLIRGRLSILGTRLDLTDGSATLQGGFDPYIRLLATSRAGGYTIGIDLDGPVSAPTITFTSTPALPEDEVLAQLLFGRSVSALSPVQILQMADAVAGLAGGSSQSGIFARLREGLGLDDLDLQTSEDGSAALRAGRYLSENIYTDVVIGDAGNTGVSLNIDLTPSITARGSFTSDGTSSLGVFFERDY
ncbi:translocation/assembly module TamB domain-containing protein [Roseicyclus persicicus]|uniref:Translocation and assembly module protein TamB n=1 Tax=Roseicyclus persicicus TaxID=2650661 RepID=A0A7X6H0V0_9RHOB|nr:translocation/assembly module TamB domain-containing protein [Roseibacterium persicicum]NKX45128.1 translocation and assembly module protein TamB [Roseibacterium persicicum]